MTDLVCLPCEQGYYSLGVQTPCKKCSTTAELSAGSTLEAYLIDTVCPDSNSLIEGLSDGIRNIAEITGTSSKTVVISLSVVFTLITILLIIGIAYCLYYAKKH